MDQLLNIKQLEFLTKLGREEDTVDLMGTKVTFRTLTVDENTQSFEAPTKEKYEDDIARFNAMRIEVLSRAIIKVDNYPVTPDFKGRMKELLKNSQQLTLNKLFEVYQELVKKQEEKFNNASNKIEGQVPNEAPPPPPQPPPAVSMPLPRPTAAQAADEPVDIVNPDNLLGPKR